MNYQESKQYYVVIDKEVNEPVFVVKGKDEALREMKWTFYAPKYALKGPVGFASGLHRNRYSSEVGVSPSMINGLSSAISKAFLSERLFEGMLPLANLIRFLNQPANKVLKNAVTPGSNFPRRQREIILAIISKNQCSHYGTQYTHFFNRVGRNAHFIKKTDKSDAANQLSTILS